MRDRTARSPLDAQGLESSWEMPFDQGGAQRVQSEDASDLTVPLPVLLNHTKLPVSLPPREEVLNLQKTWDI